MTVSGPMTLFDLTRRAMSAQLVRMNAAASNLANAGSMAASEGEAYRPLRPVFSEHMDRASGLASVRVDAVRRADVAAVREYDPSHPLADAEGNVWRSPVDENEELVEMMEASRQYQNLVEALSTAKQLMLETVRMR